jgi:predicted RNase H-like nuclease (RuvC/YqgF family)
MGSAPSTDIRPHSGRQLSSLEQVKFVERDNVLLCAEVSRLKLKVSQLTTENQSLRSELEKQVRKRKESVRIANTDNKKLKEELERIRKSLASVSTFDDDGQLSAVKVANCLGNVIFYIRNAVDAMIVLLLVWQECSGESL